MIDKMPLLDESIESVPLSFFEHDSFILLKSRDNDTRKRAMDIYKKLKTSHHILFELDQINDFLYGYLGSELISFISEVLDSDMSSHPNVDTL